MINLLLTMLYVTVSLGSLFFIGLPTSMMLNDKTSWTMAPFLGLAIIILISQNLVYIGIPLEKSFYIIWLLAALSWAAILRKYSLKDIFFFAPILLLSIALLIYLIQGAGLFIVGADYYVGRGWHDQLNYTMASQFLIDHPLGHAIQDIMYQPYAIKGITLAADRIGEIIYQGFIACTLFTNAKSTFELTILVLPFLTVFSIYLLAERLLLSKTASLFAAAIAGSLPSLAMIHLENFLSQALATPLLLLWPIVVYDALTSPNWKRLFVAALVLATATSIYTEYYIILISSACALSGFYLLKTKQYKKVSLYLLSIIIIALCLNLGFIKSLVDIASRASLPYFLSGLYPWASSFEGLDRLWLGDIASLLTPTLYFIISCLSCTAVLLAYYAFGYTALRKKNIIAFALFIFLLLPLIIYIMGIHKYEYQFYKLLLSISPLFPLGCILLLNSYKKSLWIVLLITCSATFYMTWDSTHAESTLNLNRGGAFKLLPIETQQIQNKLEALSGQNILINWHDDFFNGNFINGWLSYFARKNHLWMTNTSIGDSDLRINMATLDTLPNHFLIVTSTSNLVTGNSAKLIWKNKTYALFNVNGKHWAFLHPQAVLKP